MLLTNKAIGMDITQDEVKFALVGGNPQLPRLDGYLIEPLPQETIRLSTREQNVIDPTAFVAAIRNGYLRLLTSVKRVAVSLPDAVGRIMLLDLETRFKSREEGRDIILWKIKKSIPQDISEIHLDYQLLQEKANGEVSALVSLISLQVVQQYEDLLVEAGVEPNVIDFSTFNRYSLFTDRLDMAEYAAFVALYGKTVSIMIFNNGQLEFYRSKDIVGSTTDGDRLFREINSSLVVYREKYPGHVIGQLFCSSTADQSDLVCSVAAEAAGLEPVALDVERVIGRKAGLTIDKRTLSLLTAAIGAAKRNL